MKKEPYEDRDNRGFKLVAEDDFERQLLRELNQALQCAASHEQFEESIRMFRHRKTEYTADDQSTILMLNNAHFASHVQVMQRLTAAVTKPRPGGVSVIM